MKEVARKQGSASSPCAACKLLRRRCAPDCVFTPYFPADEPQKFANVHRVFGASNVSKMLQEVPVEQRSDAVSSMVYEANARVRDPVYGCAGAISSLQQQVDTLQTQLGLAQAEVVHMRMRHAAVGSSLSGGTASGNSSGCGSSGTASPSSELMVPPDPVSLFAALDMVVDQASLPDSGHLRSDWEEEDEQAAAASMAASVPGLGEDSV